MQIDLGLKENLGKFKENRSYFMENSKENL